MRFWIARDLDHALAHGAVQDGPDLTIDGIPVIGLAAIRAGVLRTANDDAPRLKAHLLPGLALTIEDRAELYRAGAWINR